MNWDYIKEIAIELGLNLLMAALTLFIGLWIVKILGKYIKNAFEKSKLDASLSIFLGNFFSVVLKVLVIITALMMLGLEMTSFIALLGAAGLAVGMAFSGTLSNFAGGIILLILKPFKIGDFIEAQEETGVVKEIHIFNTIMTTVDNKTIIIPNGALANGNIINYTQQETRRCDIIASIAYGDDYEKAKKVLERFIDEDERILKDPEPYIALGQLNSSSVDIVLRVWTQTPDYWFVIHNINEKIYKEFGKEGLNIPFPQMDVHLHQKNSI